MKKALIVFGTRPEAIKMAPLYLELKKSKIFETRLCVTSQHKEMLFQILEFFKIIPDYNLDVMKPNQNLFGLTSEILNKMKNVLDDYNPDLVLVHGDTTTGMAVSLASFYNKSKICHIEAGLRTHDKLSPFPEEMNRQIIGTIASLHFAPTKTSVNALLQEGVNRKYIFQTGNTAIDSILQITSSEPTITLKNLRSTELQKLLKRVVTLPIEKNNRKDPRLILLTTHRRENHNGGHERIFQAAISICKKFENVFFVLPLHPNPVVQKAAKVLENHKMCVMVVEPMGYVELSILGMFSNLMKSTFQKLLVIHLFSNCLTLLLNQI